MRRICDQLQQEKIVDEHFCSPVNHREQIVSIFPGEGFALPYSPGFQASPWLVYTALARAASAGEERAGVIFFLAIS